MFGITKIFEISKNEHNLDFPKQRKRGHLFTVICKQNTYLHSNSDRYPFYFGYNHPPYFIDMILHILTISIIYYIYRPDL